MAARVVLSLDGAILGEVELSRPLTVVGRQADCDVVIDHPAISGRHMLFRVVNRTVYAEDLASTNGMKVNGIASGRQVIHHLDVIEIGQHKIHFFDDALLAGGVGDLEDTVFNEYERTMLVAHVPDKATLALRVLAGERAGDIIALTKANTMIGSASGETALVVKRGESFFLARFGANRPPRLNRRDLGPGTHPIAPRDVIDVGSWSFEVIHAAQ